MAEPGPSVLVVDDERRLADLFAAYLQDEWDVAAVYDGETALERMTGAVDVVLLDRRMPGITGDEVLGEIRAEGYDCQVVMVTAVDPDFDIVEMGFDDYLIKPVSRETLRETVDQHATAAADPTVEEYRSLVEKKTLLERTKPTASLEESDEYADLCERVEAMEDEFEELSEAPAYRVVRSNRAT